MISNLYFWIFPAAVFIAAALSNLSFVILRKNSKNTDRSNSLVWISLNLTIAFIFIIGSVFFVNWKDLIWTWSYAYFLLIFIIVFYFAFVFKLTVGVPLIFIFSVIILFFTIYFYDWKTIPPGGIIAQYRILSNVNNKIKAELYYSETDPVFIENAGNSIQLEFETLKTNKILFFLKTASYYKLYDSSGNTWIFDKIINSFASQNILLSKNYYSLDIGNESILYKFNIIITPAKEIIIAEN